MYTTLTNDQCSLGSCGCDLPNHVQLSHQDRDQLHREVEELFGRGLNRITQTALPYHRPLTIIASDLSSPAHTSHRVGSTGPAPRLAFSSPVRRHSSADFEYREDTPTPAQPSSTQPRVLVLATPESTPAYSVHSSLSTTGDAPASDSQTLGRTATPRSYEPVSPDSKIATPVPDSTQMVPPYTPGPGVTGLAPQGEKVGATTPSANDVVLPYTLYAWEHAITSKDSNAPATVPGHAGAETDDQIERD